MEAQFNTMVLIGGYIVLTVIGLLGLAVVAKIWTGKIDLAHLIAESNGQASLSRFQFLIFTFVISSSVLLMALASLGTPTPGFPPLDTSILGLLGISGTSYVVSKGIQKNHEANLASLPKDPGARNNPPG